MSAEKLTSLEKGIREFAGCRVSGNCLRAGEAVNERRAIDKIAGQLELPKVCAHVALDECFYGPNGNGGSNGQEEELAQITDVSYPVHDGQP